MVKTLKPAALALSASLAFGGVAVAQTGGADAARDSDDCQGIPCDQLPPAGQCRIWIPGKAASEQSPPQDCDSAAEQAPEDAMVIFGSFSN